MFITPNQDFRHDYGLFKEGKIYEVPDQLGQYFVNVEWADGYDSREAAADDGVEPQQVSGNDRTPPVQFSVDKKCNVVEHKDSQGRLIDALHSDLGMKGGRAFSHGNVPTQRGALLLANPREARYGDELLEIQDSDNGQNTEL